MSPLADTDTTTATMPDFPTLENEIDGVIANARISFALTTATRAAEHGEWSRAVEALDKLADKLVRWKVGRKAWRELLIAAAWYGVRGSIVAGVEPLFEAHSERAWAGGGRASMPWDLHEVFEEADRCGRYDAGGRLGHLIDALYPRCPLGSYAAAHFTEQSAQLRSAHLDAAAVAARFEHAALLADSIALPTTSARARLRAGTLLLRTATSRQRGRELLRTVDPGALGRSDRLWYAVGMAHSPFWLDRVRAADAVLTVVEGDGEPTPDAGDTVGYLLACAPVELQPLERDRFDALADNLGEVSDLVGLRTHLEGIASAPATCAGDAADILAQFYGGNDDTRKRAQVTFCRLLGGLLSGDESTGVDDAALEHIAPDFPVAAKVLGALEPIVGTNVRKLATALGDLEGLFRKRDHTFGPDDVAPVALLWPRLLPLVRQLQADDATDATTLRRIVASSQEVLDRWLPLSATPGYGWWALAANLLASDLSEQALAAARRAIDDGESVDADLERRVIAAVLDRAVQSGEPDDMLEWLDVAEARFSE